MKILILSESINQSFFNECGVDFTDFELVIDLHEGEYSFNNITFTYKNIIELVRYIEKFNIQIDDIWLFSGILSYSSEINIRLLFSGLSNAVNSKFYYIDKNKIFENKFSLINRCLLAIGKNPIVIKGVNLTTLEFDQKERNWSNFSYELMINKIENMRASHLDFMSELEEAVANELPFSFVRLNHCENRLMGQGVTFPKEEADIAYKRQFGYILEEKETNYISYRMKMAVKNSNVIGVPEQKNNSTDKLHLLENTTFFHLINFSLVKEQSFIDVNTHYFLGEFQAFKKVLENCKHLVAITCRDLEPLQKILDRKIDILKIPAQSNFSDSDQVAEKHFPDIFYSLEKEIKDIVKPGSIVIIGAGILGKIYCDIVKECGGIALDVGSLMDAIAKKDTRGGGFDRFNFWWD